MDFVKTKCEEAKYDLAKKLIDLDDEDRTKVLQELIIEYESIKIDELLEDRVYTRDDGSLFYISTKGSDWVAVLEYFKEGGCNLRFWNQKDLCQSYNKSLKLVKYDRTYKKLFKKKLKYSSRLTLFSEDE